jgi:hypothetical protein
MDSNYRETIVGAKMCMEKSECDIAPVRGM